MIIILQAKFDFLNIQTEILRFLKVETISIKDVTEIA